MANKITIRDSEGQEITLDENDLMVQLAQSMTQNTASAVVKGVLRNFANAVKEMRDAQKAYFSAQYGTPEKNTALSASKECEKKVDKLIVAVYQTLPKI